MTINDFLARFDSRIPTDGQFKVRCPAHDDKQASLAVREGTDGRILLKCHAGCSTDSILSALRLTVKDLFPAERTKGRRQEIATYDYTDKRGTLLYQSVRFVPKGFAQRRPDGAGGSIWKLDGVERVVYRLKDIQGKEGVVLVEGEKDVDALWRIGIPATCNVGGAGKWRDTYADNLVAAGVKRVVVIPDNDNPGLEHADEVAQSCRRAGLSVKRVVLPDVPLKGDVSDYLAAHDKADLMALLKAAVPYDVGVMHDLARRNARPAEPVPTPHTRQPSPTKRAADKVPQGRTVATLFDDPEPWPEPVDLAVLLDDIVGVVNRHVVLAEGAADAITLWVAFTYLMDVWQVAPNLMLTSPTKQCGKTRALQVVAGLAYRALPCSSMTGPVLFRVIEKYGPTLLIDEAENALNDKDNELYALLNAGHTRTTAKAIRNVGDKHEPAIFSTWAPKVFALIGKLRDTAMDRSIAVEMRRRKADESVAPMRAVAFDAACMPIRRRLLRWAEDSQEQATAIEPAFPTGLRDRAQDNWSSLLVIAQLAGPSWVERAHRAALLLSGGEEANDDSIHVQLLEDCRAIFDEVGGEAIGSTKLVELLNALEGRPYADRQGRKGVTTAWLARELKRFKIQSAGTQRFGPTTAKGYRWTSFQESWARYLSPRDTCDGPTGSRDGRCDGSEHQNQPINTEGCYGVTGVTGVQGRDAGAPLFEDVEL